jgi:hypothetical protein
MRTWLIVPLWARWSSASPFACFVARLQLLTNFAGRVARLQRGCGKLATGGGSIDVEALRQSTSPAEGAHNIPAVAFAYRRFHKRNTTFHQGIGRHFGIGPQVHAVEHQLGCPRTQNGSESLFAKGGADHRVIRC